MRFDTVLFDLDGTLTDPFEGITKCVQYALHKLGIEEPDRDKLKGFIGPPLAASFMEQYGLDAKQAEQAVQLYRERFVSVGLYENEIIPGIPEMLARLKEKGLCLAVASSKPLVYVRQILDHFSLSSFFTFIGGSELNGARTEKAAVIEYTLAHLPKDAKAVMVGDRLHDMAGAQAAGIPCVGVLFGYGSREELSAHPHLYLAETVPGLEACLRAHCARSPSICLRPYRPEDLDALLALFYSAVHASGQGYYSPEQLDAWAPAQPDRDTWAHTLHKHFSLVAEVDGLLAGFADLEEPGRLDRLYVAPPYQKAGVGRALAEALERRAEECGCKELTVDASYMAKPFFQERGYHVVRQQQVTRHGVTLTNFHMCRSF